MSVIGPSQCLTKRVVQALGAGCTVLSLGLVVAACDDDRTEAPASQTEFERQQAETPAAQPPNAAPGAAPSAARVNGTWTILSAPGSPSTGDKAEGTTYRFEEAGKVTVAGAKPCAYRLDGADLTVDCDGAPMAGPVSFPDAETMVWTVAGKERLTLKKR